MKPSEYYLRQIERKRELTIPQSILNNKGVKALDEALLSGSVGKVQQFYKNFEKYYDLTALKEASRNIKRKRKLDPADVELIRKLVSHQKKDAGLFFEIAGNLMYLSQVIDALKSQKRLKKILRVSVLLWMYLNIIEVVNKYLSEFTLNAIQNENKQDLTRFKPYTKKFKPGKYPEIGVNLKALEDLGYLSNQSKSIFYKNKLIRNKLSHASMYYDSKSGNVYVSTGEIYEIKQLKYDLKGLLEFVYELTYQLNGSNSDVYSVVKELLNTMSRKFQIIWRSGELRKRFQTIVLEWRKAK